jgi:hypothetical protein
MASVALLAAAATVMYAAVVQLEKLLQKHLGVIV